MATPLPFVFVCGRECTSLLYAPLFCLNSFVLLLRDVDQMFVRFENEFKMSFIILFSVF